MNGSSLGPVAGSKNAIPIDTIRNIITTKRYLSTDVLKHKIIYLFDFTKIKV